MNLLASRLISVAFSAVLLVIHAPLAEAVAYCALRDPVNTIYELFPEADSYRSNVQTVGRDTRQQVMTQLPIKMHFNELGRHTLYIALKQGNLVGFVHARSEPGNWGITEFAWAIEPDLTIRSVKVQRSRDPEIRKVGPEQLNEWVVGKSLAELKESHSAAVSAGAASRAVVFASALKTLVITESAWPSELPVGVALSHFKRALPEIDRADRIYDLYNPDSRNRLENLGLSESPAFQRERIVGYNLRNADNQSIGLALRVPFDLHTPAKALWWLVSTTGEILSVVNAGTFDTSTEFKSVLGYAPLSMRDCSTLADLAALELSTLTRHHSASATIDAG